MLLTPLFPPSSFISPIFMDTQFDKTSGKALAMVINMFWGVDGLRGALLLVVLVTFQRTALAEIPAEAEREWMKYATNEIKSLKLESKDQNLQRSSDLSYKQNGSNRLFISEELKNGMWVGTVWGQNDRYCFKLHRQGRDKSWVITFLALKSRAQDGASVESRLAQYHLTYSTYPIVINHLPLTELVHLKSFQADNPKSADAVRPELRSISFQVDPKDKSELSGQLPALYKSGRLILDSSRSWLPVAYELEFPNGGMMKFTNSDLRKQNGLWFPRIANCSAKARDAAEVPEARSVVVDLETDRPTSLRDFTLSAFGLPEPSADSSLFRTAYFWLALLGLFLLATGFYWRRRYFSTSVH